MSKQEMMEQMMNRYDMRQIADYMIEAIPSTISDMMEQYEILDEDYEEMPEKADDFWGAFWQAIYEVNKR